MKVIQVLSIENVSLFLRCEGLKPSIGLLCVCLLDHRWQPLLVLFQGTQRKKCSKNNKTNCCWCCQPSTDGAVFESFLRKQLSAALREHTERQVCTQTVKLWTEKPHEFLISFSTSHPHRVPELICPPVVSRCIFYFSRCIFVFDWRRRLLHDVIYWGLLMKGEENSI